MTIVLVEDDCVTITLPTVLAWPQECLATLLRALDTALLGEVLSRFLGTLSLLARSLPEDEAEGADFEYVRLAVGLEGTDREMEGGGGADVSFLWVIVKFPSELVTACMNTSLD